MDPTKRGFGLGKGERREGAGQRGEVGGREKGLGRGRAMRREVRAGLGRDRKSTRLNSSHLRESRIPSSA